MFTAINDLLLKIADPLLGWLLWLPTDVVLVVVGVATGAILTFARPWTTNQDLLRRCSQDKKHLRQLIKEAKKKKDKESVRRYRSSLGMISLKTLKSEGLPLLEPFITTSVKMRESHQAHRPLIDLAPRHKLSQQFEALYDALEARHLAAAS